MDEKNEKDYVVVGKRTEELACELTDAELAERAGLMASTRKRQHTIERRKAVANSEFSASLKECSETLDSLAETIKSRKETRPVECEERAIPELGRATLYRLDTMAVIRERTLTPKELEKYLGGGATEKPVEGDGKPGEVVDLKVHQGGKGKGRKKKKGGESADEEEPKPDETPSPAAASDASSSPATSSDATADFERCPHPDCTLAVEHDGPHVVKEPVLDPPSDEL